MAELTTKSNDAGKKRIVLLTAVLTALLTSISGSSVNIAIPSIGMAVTAGSLVLFTFLDEKTPLAYILAILVVFGLGLSLFASPNTNAAMSAVERKYYGISAATLSSMRLIGQTLSLGIAMVILAIYVGNVQITAEYFPTFLIAERTMFLVCAVLCFGGIFASLARGQVRTEAETERGMASQ